MIPTTHHKEAIGFLSPSLEGLFSKILKAMNILPGG